MVKNNWDWTFQNDKATFIAIHPNRGYKAIEQIMPEGFQKQYIGYRLLGLLLQDKCFIPPDLYCTFAQRTSVSKREI